MQLEVPRHKHAGNLQFADQRMHVLPARRAPADTAAPPLRNPRAAQTAPIIISLMRGKSSPPNWRGVATHLFAEDGAVILAPLRRGVGRAELHLLPLRQLAV